MVFGHIMRMNGFENFIAKGRVKGHKVRGKHRLTFISSTLSGTVA